jgi:DNA-binding protein HU-beta
MLDLARAVDCNVRRIRTERARTIPQEVAVNKSELVESVAERAGVDRRSAEGVLNAFFETVQSEAKGGGSVSWPGFGKFSTSQRGARTGRNPQTGAPVKIAASTAMKFSASSALKDFLNSRGGAKKAAGTKKAGAKKATAKKAAGAKKATKAAGARRR